MVIAFGDHGMGKRTKARLAALDRQGWHLTRDRRIAILAIKMLFDMANDRRKRQPAAVQEVQFHGMMASILLPGQPTRRDFLGSILDRKRKRQAEAV